MNLNYPDLDYPFGPSEELFPEAAANEKKHQAARLIGPGHVAVLAVKSDWHYRSVLRRPWLTWAAIAFSASFHIVFLFGFNQRSRPRASVASSAMEVTLMEFPEKLKDIEEDTSDPGDKAPELAAGVDAPSLPDIPPSVVLDGAFIQPVDLSSLQPRMNLDGAKVSTIPTLVRHGGQGGNGLGLGKVFDLASLDRPPTAIFQAVPQIPANLRDHPSSVKVRVEFIVTAKGEVVEARILDSDLREFEDVALRAVLKWRFRPGFKNGRAVNVRIQQPMTFNFTE